MMPNFRENNETSDDPNDNPPSPVPSDSSGTSNDDFDPSDPNICPNVRLDPSAPVNHIRHEVPSLPAPLHYILAGPPRPRTPPPVILPPRIPPGPPGTYVCYAPVGTARGQNNTANRESENTNRNDETDETERLERGIQMGVYNARPGCTLSSEQTGLLRTKLIQALDRTRDVRTLPRFLKSWHDQGVFWMVCADEGTRRWLVENVARLNRECEGLEVRAMDVRTPNRARVSVHFSELDGTQEVLTRLRKQNPGLSTNRWKVLSRTLSDKGQTLTIIIDGDSLKYLKAKGFVLAWKLETVVFKISKNDRKKKEGGQKPWGPTRPTR